MITGVHTVSIELKRAFRGARRSEGGKAKGEGRVEGEGERRTGHLFSPPSLLIAI